MSITRRDFLKFSSLLAASMIYQAKSAAVIHHSFLRPKGQECADHCLRHPLSKQHQLLWLPPGNNAPPHPLTRPSTVYHNHYASSNFTTPGTASIFTGRYPWDHQATKLSQVVRKELETRNIFSYFDQYYKQAYSHNHFVGLFLNQFKEDISIHQANKPLFLEHELSNPWFNQLMDKDIDTALLFKNLLSDPSRDGYLYSLLFPSLFGQDAYQLPSKITDRFPRGVPEADGRGPFILEDAIDWTMEQSSIMTQPYLGYFHFLPPHNPYNTPIEYVDSFRGDGFEPPEKPLHPIVIPNEVISRAEELENRRLYDEFVLYVDSEFNRLYTYLEQQGVINNTLLIFTSDHGELFERNMMSHNDPYLFEPVVKVPLIIFEPGQTERRDVHALTSCIDLLPTLLHYTDHEIPSSLPGQILPPFVEPDPEQSRRVFAMDSRLNREFSHITTATLMMRTGNFKVIRYSDYADNYRLLRTY